MRLGEKGEGDRDFCALSSRKVKKNNPSVEIHPEHCTHLWMGLYDMSVALSVFFFFHSSHILTLKKIREKIKENIPDGKILEMNIRDVDCFSEVQGLK